MEGPAGTLSIKASPINGLGVFAETGFQAGDVVLTMDDSHRVDERHPVPAGEEHYCDFLGGGQIIWMQVPERHINHSCEPNVFVESEDGIRRVVAMRDVQPGDEITYDYCINGFGDVVWQCHCGSQRCRREVHSDFFHLPIELQAEYLPYLNDWFRFERADEVAELERKMSSLVIGSRSEHAAGRLGIGRFVLICGAVVAVADVTRKITNGESLREAGLFRCLLCGVGLFCFSRCDLPIRRQVS